MFEKRKRGTFWTFGLLFFRLKMPERNIVDFGLASYAEMLQQEANRRKGKTVGKYTEYRS